jgi:hypothetical protein
VAAPTTVSVVAYGAALWRELREGRLDALVAPTGHASPDVRILGLGSDPWVVLVGTGHRLAGIGPVAAKELDGERIAVTGHRDAAVFDRAVAELLAELGVAAELVPGAPGPALGAEVARNDLIALTTAPAALPAGVVVRPLDPSRALSFELLTPDEDPSPALAEFLSLGASTTPPPALSRPLAAVA